MKKRIKGLIIAALLLVCMAIPVSAAVGKYDFQQKSVSVQVGKSKNLYVCNNGKTINPKKFHWKSSNPKVISVTNGKITANNWGNAKIYAISNGQKIRCNVYAYRESFSTSFKGYSEGASIKIKIGTSIRLRLLRHGNITIYKVSNPKIASISSDGVLKPKTTGTVKISCISYGRNKYFATAKITIGAELASVIAPNEMVICTGEKKSIGVSFQPKNAYVKSITYMSSNESVVKVSKDGQIIAQAPGIAKITVIVNSGKKIKKSIQVYVRDINADISDMPLDGTSKKILHRGLSWQAPENSLPAFELAGQMGAQYIETDVRETKDGVFVISHDDTLMRMCGVDKNISDLTYEEIKQYPIINGPNASSYQNNIIPTLEQYLQCCNKYSVTPVIEIKVDFNEAEIIKFNQTIKMSSKNPVVISFYEEPLKILRQMNKAVDIQLIIRSQITDAILDECCRYKFDISAKYKYTDRNIIRRAHLKNIRVALWLFTDLQMADCYKQWGADYLTCENF